MKGSDPVDSLVFAWPSSGQRKTLLESIEGHAKNLHQYGRSVPLLLSIDGKRNDLDTDISSGLEKLYAQYPKQFRIVDSDSRHAFLESLPQNIDRESASYALLPPLNAGTTRQGPGNNRNMMLLSSAGRLLIASDDDILCTPVTCKKELGGPVFTSNLFPLPLRFYPYRSSLLAEVSETSCDIAEQHLQYLGHQASEFIGTEHPAAQGKILFTCAGYYGDSGLGRARTVLALKDEMRLHMLKYGYEDTRYSREVTRIPERDLIGPSMVFMTGHSGYDVREYLPPFFPIGGNEDGFFAMLVRVCTPGSLTAFPSFGLLHNPPEHRPHTRESLVGFKPGITELLMALTLACMPDSSIADTRNRMIQLGVNYMEISRLTNTNFVELIHHCWTQGAMAYVEELETLLDTYDRQPTLWANDVDELIGNIYTLMREPLELFGSTCCGLQVEELATQVNNYGSLLTVWPDMLDFAKKTYNPKGIISQKN